MARREISSSSTFIWKFIFPIFWISLMSVGAIISLFHVAEEPAALMFIFGWLIGSALLIWFALRLKFVSIDERFLYVSNYREEIQIPLSHIESVKENFMLNPKLITLKLRSPSEFGEKVVFVPPLMFFGALRSHPMVKELKHIIKSHRRI